MAEKKSILEEALLDINNIEKALKANTKEILRSVMKEEINGVVKESLTNEVYEEEDLDSPEGETELGADADAAVAGLDAVGGAEDSIEGMPSDIESPEGVPSMEPEIGMDADALGGEMDMTAASDDDVIAIYKKLSGEDEIEIVGDEIHLNVSEPGEYVIKANDTPLGGEVAGGEEAAPADLEPVDDVDYEIEIGDEEEGSEAPADLEPVSDEEGTEGEESEEEEAEEEIDETIANVNGRAGRQGARRSGASHLGFDKSSMDGEKLEESAELAKAKKLVSESATKYNRLLAEHTALKAQNEQFKGALKEFRTKLVETVVFNSNLSYVTRLFMEHSTTKAEKANIIKRFDIEVSTLKESKKLYSTISNELENRKPINESVENKIIKEATTSVSKQLNESTAYVDPSTKRIIDLIKRVEEKK
jgi:hypothetical protein